MSFNSPTRCAQLAAESWTSCLAALSRPSTPQRNWEFSQERISLHKGLFSTPAFAFLGPVRAMPPWGTGTLAATAPQQEMEKEVCIPTRGGTELVTESVGLVRGFWKQRGFEPWQCRKSCLRWGLLSTCDKLLREDGAHPAWRVWFLFLFCLLYCENKAAHFY